MNGFSRNLNFFFVVFGAVVLVEAGTALGGDTNFPGNVTISSNLVVKGTVTASNDVDVVGDMFVTGSLAVANMGPAQANTSIAISGAGSDCGGPAGDVLINGGEACDNLDAGSVIITGGGAYVEGHGGSVVLQGGSGENDGAAGDVILRNRDNVDPPSQHGFVKLQTSDGTTRVYLQQDGTLNAGGNYIKQANILPQGDLSMGSYTNHP